MNPTCPDPARLAAYADRRLGESERSVLEAHLALCPDCLGEIRILLDQARPAQVRTLRWSLSAAAALLLAVFVLAWRGPSAPSTPVHPTSLPAARPIPPVAGTVLAAGERARGWVLADGTRVSLSVGGEALLAAAGVLDVHRGSLWAEVTAPADGGDRKSVV